MYKLKNKVQWRCIKCVNVYLKECLGELLRVDKISKHDTVNLSNIKISSSIKQTRLIKLTFCYGILVRDSCLTSLTPII